MKRTAFPHAAYLLGLALITACSEAEQSPKVIHAALTEQAQPLVPLEEGSFGVIRHGDLSFGDCEAVWTIYTHSPMTIDMTLAGSEGHYATTSKIYGEEGPCIYNLRFSQEEVRGSELLSSLRVLAEKEASDAVLSAIPNFEERSAFRFDLQLGLTKSYTAPDKLHEAIDLTGSSATSSGWVPGSKVTEQGLGGATASSSHGEEATLEQHPIGEPLFLAYFAELPTQNGSLGFRERDGDLSISYSKGSDEERSVPLSEYEGRAWALKITLSEPE